MIRVPLSVIVVVVIGACSDRDKPEINREPVRPRRVIEPQPRGVRALPPHAIRADGVGPYKLGAPAAELLDQLPSGPRIRQFAIPGIVHRDMLRGEDDAILIGTEPQGKAMFVAVVRSDIARTEAGIAVGSTREELERALGTPSDELDRARDPRVIVPPKLDNAHFVMADDRIAAIVLTPAVERSKEPAAEPKESKEPKEPACQRPAGDRRATFGACLTAAGELLRFTGDELAVLARDGEKAITRLPVPGLVFAAALRHPADGKDDIIAITKDDAAQSRTWSLIAYRLIDHKLMRVIEPTPLYQLSAGQARWIGADLRDLDLFLELTAKGDTIEVGGLLTTHVGAKIRDIVVISPVPVARRRAKAPPVEPAGAGSSDSQGTPGHERPTR